MHDRQKVRGGKLGRLRELADVAQGLQLPTQQLENALDEGARVLPLVAAMGLGHWIGRRTGSLVPPLVGAGVGLFAGGWGVWRAITRDLEGEDEERAVKEEETP